MRITPVLLLGLVPAMLAACSPEPVGALAGAEIASVAVFGRGIVDLGVSAVSGKDCSIVRLDKGLTYCAPKDQPPQEAYCTRTLAAVDCWPSPAFLPVYRQGVGDTPASTQEQERYRAARWPKSLNAS